MNGTTIYNAGKNSNVVNNFFCNIVGRNATAKNSYRQILAQVVEKNNATLPLTETEKISADMSLDEYKNYFAQRLGEIPFHATRSNDVELIHISNAAWHRLKSDPDYEEKILSTIAGERATPNQLQGIYSSGEMKVRYIEAAEENCRVVSTEDGRLANLNFDVNNFVMNGNKALIRRLREARQNILTQELFRQVGTLQQLKLEKFAT